MVVREDMVSEEVTVDTGVKDLLRLATDMVKESVDTEDLVVMEERVLEEAMEERVLQEATEERV